MTTIIVQIHDCNGFRDQVEKESVVSGHLKEKTAEAVLKYKGLYFCYHRVVNLNEAAFTECDPPVDLESIACNPNQFR